jgi:hypothetical protein
MAQAEAGGVPLERLEEMQLDETVHDETVNFSVLQLSEKERQILELYDRLEEIMMEISLVQAQDAQTTVSNGMASAIRQVYCFQHSLILPRAVRSCQ